MKQYQRFLPKKLLFKNLLASLLLLETAFSCNTSALSFDGVSVGNSFGESAFSRSHESYGPLILRPDLGSPYMHSEPPAVPALPPLPPLPDLPAARTASPVMNTDLIPLASRMYGLNMQMHSQLQVFANFSRSNHSDLLVVGNKDTIVTQHHTDSSDAKKLVSGRLVIDTGAEPVSLETSLGPTNNKITIKINPNAAAIVDVKPNQQIRIQALGGQSGKSLTVSSPKEQQSISLATGEEVLIGDEETFIMADGSNSQPVQASLVFAGNNAVKRSLPLEKSVNDWDCVVAGTTIHVNGNHKHLSRLQSHIKEAAIRQAIALRTQGRELRPVISHIDLKEGVVAKLLSTPATAVAMVDSETIEFAAGSLFMDLPHQLRFKTQLAEINAKKGTALVIDTGKDSLRIKVCAGSPAAIKVDKNNILIPPGREALILCHSPTSNEREPRDGVGRRCVKTFALHDGKTMTISDFSIPSLLQTSPLLQEIRSTSSKANKQLFERLLKTALAIRYVMSYKGNYSVQY